MSRCGRTFWCVVVGVGGLLVGCGEGCLMCFEERVRDGMGRRLKRSWVVIGVDGR